MEHGTRGRAATRLAVFACAAAVAACGGGGDSAPAPAARAPSHLDSTSFLTVAAGAGGSVRVTVGAAGATVAAEDGLSFAVGAGIQATLRAVPAAGYRFERWGGACVDFAAAACELAAGALTADATADARFEPVPYTLGVSASAGGSVAVSIGAAGAVAVEAGQFTALSVTVETAAALRAVPAAGYRFAGWGGACALALAACELAAGALTADATAGAHFEPVPYSLGVSASAGGSVAVALGTEPAETVAAGSGRSFAVDVETAAALAAEPAARYRFAGWGGACAGFAAACELAAGALTADATAAARFKPVTRTLTVRAGHGGSVSVAIGAEPAETVAAGSSRSFDVTVETAAALAAEPAERYRFAGWTGACAGFAAACELAAGALTADATAAARFEPVPYTLVVSASAGGSVSVAIGAEPAETVAAGSSRSFAVDVETAAALAAEPAERYRFAGWGGACADFAAAACELAAGALTADATAAARFEPVIRTLTVRAGHGGSVSVAIGAEPAETVAASASRGFDVTVKTAAALVAEPAAGWRFAGWAGACADFAGGACALAPGAFTADAAAAASFELVPYTLVVSASAGGSVSVTLGGQPAETVAAGSSRSFDVDVETAAALVAAPAEHYRFAGWTGACTSAFAACVLVAGAFTADAAAAASFELVPYTLVVSASAGGSVAVALGGQPAGTVAAGSSRSFTVTVETAAALAAAPTEHYRFAGWTGACAGSGGACELSAGAFIADAAAAASFEAVTRTLTVRAGHGGSVSVALGGQPAETVAAGSSRSFDVDVETAVALAAEPAAGYRFAGWTGACADFVVAACALAPGALTADAAAAARFELVPYTLVVSASAGGSVAVAIGAEPAETVAAGSSRSFDVDVETAAALAAAPAERYRFAGWTGACAGPAAACELSAGAFIADAAAAASFEPVPYTLVVSASAGGSVAVALGTEPAETVAAGSSRSFDVDVETAAALAAAPAAGWRFAGWGGACADFAAAACALSAAAFTADAAAAASFEPVPYTLVVSASAGGSVAVALGTEPAETVAAGSSRSFDVDVETAAALAAEPAAGWRFAGWAGACAGSVAACELAAGAFTADAAAAARFELVPYTLVVSASAGGSVAVALGAEPAETVAAGSSRSFTATVETAAALAAAPAAGYRFAGWTGACAGSAAACELSAGALTADAAAAARFELVPYTLVVSASAGGSVAVAIGAEPAETVAAGSSRSFDVDVETAAALAAAPAAGYRFAGWTGACAGSAAACELSAGAFIADAAAAASFEPVPYTLVVSASAGGSVAVALGTEPAETVAAGSSRSFDVDVGTAAALAAAPAAGWRFAGWTGACAGSAAACELSAGSLSADAVAAASFEAVTRTLTVRAARGGSVGVVIRHASDTTVAAGSSRAFAVSVATLEALEAVPAERYRFARWTGACAGAGVVCMPAAREFGGDLSASAVFEPIAYALTVSSPRGGSVLVSIDGEGGREVPPDSERAFAVSVETAAVMAAAPAVGYRFGHWTGICASSGGESCERRAGFFTADASVAVVFVPLARTLFVTAEGSGSVDVTVRGETTALRARGQAFGVTAEDSATLTAAPDEGHRFAGWIGTRCAAAPGRVCAIPTGALAVDAAVGAGFAERITWVGPGAVSQDGATLSAVPYASGAFVGWRSGPCDGSASLDCDVAALPQDAAWPVAEFHPFTVDGIKSLAFGLNYHARPPSHFRVSFQAAPSAGFAAVPGLGGLTPGPAPARLAVSVHLLEWGSGGYLTEACDAGDACVPALGGQRSLARADSVAAAGYFKTPNAGDGDQFGAAVALSADGSTLAAGAPFEDSSATGAFAASDPLWAAVLADEGAAGSGAAAVYRRLTTGHWTIEAFVKAPAANAYAKFGATVALSADGGALAVGAPFEHSSATGAVAASDPGWAAALAYGGAPYSGAVTVYRRGSSGRWAFEAFVKAPATGVADQFGAAIALSADGETLAVTAIGEDSSATGAFAASDPGWMDALDDNGAAGSGAVTVYRRGSSGRWAIEAFVKAPVADAEDWFGQGLALSADGGALAVGAHLEDSSFNGAVAASDPGWTDALDDNGAQDSGGVYIYHRALGRWAVRHFVKAPVAGAGDNFGQALALSGDATVLAVGARDEDSAAVGVIASGPDYGTALASSGARNSGAAYVYRRDSSRRWTFEAFIKAPVADAADWFGRTLALAADGGTLAVGAPFEDSSTTGAFAASDPGWTAALDNGNTSSSGAAYVYRRESGSWTAKTFVKAPNTDADDRFGLAVALSADGGTLAVGAQFEDGAAPARPLGGGSEQIDAGADVLSSGAVYLY